eukprot:jgi/Pico_ML_1/54188/g4599.t1
MFNSLLVEFQVSKLAGRLAFQMDNMKRISKMENITNLKKATVANALNSVSTTNPPVRCDKQM